MRLTAVLLITLLAAGSLSAQEPDSLREYLISGARAYNANDFSASRTAYENALRLQPGNVEAIRNLGIIANTLGDLKTAMKYFEEALKYDSTDATIYNNIGVVMSARGQKAQAISNFEKALRFDSANAQIHVNLAGEFIEAGRFADAAKHLRGPMAVDTLRPEPPYLLGRAMLGLRKNDSAIQYFNLAVVRGGSAAELYFYRGVAEMNLGKWTDAGNSMAAALVKEPKHVQASHSLGIVRVKQSRYDDALKMFQRTVELDSSFMAGWVSLGAMYMVTGKPAPADTIYRKLSAIDTTLGYRMIDLYNLEHAKQQKDAPPAEKPDKK